MSLHNPRKIIAVREGTKIRSKVSDGTLYELRTVAQETAIVYAIFVRRTSVNVTLSCRLTCLWQGGNTSPRSDYVNSPQPHPNTRASFPTIQAMDITLRLFPLAMGAPLQMITGVTNPLKNADEVPPAQQIPSRRSIPIVQRVPVSVQNKWLRAQNLALSSPGHRL